MKLLKLGSGGNWVAIYRGQTAVAPSVGGAIMSAMVAAHGTMLNVAHLTNGSKV